MTSKDMTMKVKYMKMPYNNRMQSNLAKASP
jgi:hypothetical protein